jgi:hypothetical protein
VDAPFSLSRLQHADADDFCRKPSKATATTTTTNTHSDISESQSTSDHPSQKVANIIRDLINMAKNKKTQPIKLGFLIKVEIDLIKIAVSTPPTSNFDHPKSASLGLSTPCFA